jgi:hypothetical protein
MKCRRARHLLFEFIDGMGDEVLRAELDRHLAGCEECERFADETTRALSVLKRAPMQPLDENFNWKVRLAIHRERNARRSGAPAGAWVRAWNLRYVASASAAFAVVLVAGAWLVSNEGVNGVLPSHTPAPVTGVERDAVPGLSSRGVSQPLVPGRVGPRSPGTPVSFGDHPTVSTGAPLGAIDASTSEAAIDSLVGVQLQLLPREEQARCLQRLISRFEYRLQSQHADSARPH